MKLLPEVPTEEMWNRAWNGIKVNDELARVRKVLSIEEIRTLFDHFNQAMCSAAPEVSAEPVAFARTFNGVIMVDGLTVYADAAERGLKQMNDEFPEDADKRKITPLYAAPPETEKLKAEIERLKGAIRKHRLYIWGDGSVDHAHDIELYEALEEGG